MAKTMKHEQTEDRQGWRHLIRRANIALSERRADHARLRRLAVELGAACRDPAASWEASYQLGESWGEVSDRLGQQS